MRIAICSTSDNSEALVATQFARCEYFMIYDHDTLESRFITNIVKDEASRVGSKAAKYLADQNIDLVLVPKIGLEAHNVLAAQEIKVYEYKQGVTTIKALYDYFAHEYKEVD